MNSSAGNSRIQKENCAPTQIAMESPSSRIRRQFHRTTSRGAYSVCATAMLVKIRPKPPQAPTMDGPIWLADADGQRREAIQAERDVSADVAVKTARDIPQRSAQQAARQQKRQPQQEAIVVKFGDVASRRRLAAPPRRPATVPADCIVANRHGLAFQMQQSALDITPSSTESR